MKSSPSNYGVSVTVVNRYWDAEIYVEGASSSEVAKASVRGLLAELPLAGEQNHFMITGVRKLP